jgi:hypothetical protein
MNEEIENILSDIEDILNTRWQDKEWTPAEIVELTDGLETLTQDALEVNTRTPDEDDEMEDISGLED